MISRLRPLPRPKPIVQSGGISATAIATPGRAVTPLPPPRQTTTDPAKPDNSAIPKSSRLGFVRAMISAVAE